MEAWTIKDAAVRLSPGFVGYSKCAVEQKVVATHYDAHTLVRDCRYRDLFEKELQQELSDRGYTIVPIRLVEIEK